MSSADKNLLQWRTQGLITGFGKIPWRRKKATLNSLFTGLEELWAAINHMGLPKGQT